ncbi:sterol desaturase family protein [Paucibacter sediminis]|uniref:Sterol desaturase family protein n=1 Tax=Paucibacter sediminis TaxID=3019553 RepID=A0AA95NH12_9BURK|nr:sterol desaturase family protein [Paucibacter sp. S2-9]WIT12078.1 sterol desaturase family protein [Paucibacter sp. S2-9]
MTLLYPVLSKTAYRLDFALYGLACTLLAGLLLRLAWRAGWAPILLGLACIAAGVLLWSLIEYAVHRFVFHGMQPFKRWHAAHHQQPGALIGMPTVLSVPLFAGLVFLPAWALLGLPAAAALMLGVLGAYIAYGVVHHLSHHGGRLPPWLLQRRHWHALHHRSADAGRYGVSSSFWDRAFGSC